MHTTNVIFYFLIISTIILCCSTEEIEIQATEPQIVEENVHTAETEAFLGENETPVNNSTAENSTTAGDNETTVEPAGEQLNTTHRYVNCLPGMGSSQVQIVNDTELIKLLLPNANITSRDTPASCLCVLFYSKHCQFSSLAAPHFNALPRAFPDVKMVAINAIIYHLFNTQNGIVGVPSLLLLHNGKIIDKFNESDYTLEQFSRFITKNTGIPAAEKSFVTSADFAGPVACSPNRETDILLVASWCFIIFCTVYYFTQSRWWRWIVESVKHNWRESEAQAQHEHAD